MCAQWVQHWVVYPRKEGACDGRLVPKSRAWEFYSISWGALRNVNTPQRRSHKPCYVTALSTASLLSVFFFVSVFPQIKCFIAKKIFTSLEGAGDLASHLLLVLPVFLSSQEPEHYVTSLKHSLLAPSLEKVGPCAPSLVLFPFLFAVCVLSRFSCVGFFATLWTVARQAALPTGSFRQEYWSGWPCPSPGDLPARGIKPASPAFPALAGGFFTASTTSVIKFMILLMFHVGLLVFLLPPSLPSFCYPSFPFPLLFSFSPSSPPSRSKNTSLYADPPTLYLWKALG